MSAARAARSVAFLSSAFIEHLAGRVLDGAARSLGIVLEPPIPIDAIVEHHLGVTLEIDDLARAFGRPDVLGATWLEAPGRIVLDRSLHPESGRFFFTLAHEAGHWVLHNAQAQNAPVVAAVPPPSVCADPEALAARPRAEVQADRFAAAMLMPAVFVRDAFARVRDEGYAYPGDEFVDVVRDVGCFTNVSRQALAIRLHALGLVGPRRRSASG